MRLTCTAYFTVVIRVTAEAGRCCYCAGPPPALTAWHRESALLDQYYGFPLDGYEAEVQEVFPAARPEILLLKVSRHSGSGGLGAITISHPLFLGGWSGTASDVLLNRLGRAAPAAGHWADENWWYLPVSLRRGGPGPGAGEREASGVWGRGEQSDTSCCYPPSAPARRNRPMFGPPGLESRSTNRLPVIVDLRFGRRSRSRWTGDVGL